MTVCSRITKMFQGFTKGCLYKIHAMYAHFPINRAITEGGTLIGVPKFLETKFVRKERMHRRVSVEDSKAEKDKFIQ